MFEFELPKLPSKRQSTPKTADSDADSDDKYQFNVALYHSSSYQAPIGQAIETASATTGVKATTLWRDVTCVSVGSLWSPKQLVALAHIGRARYHSLKVVRAIGDATEAKRKLNKGDVHRDTLTAHISDLTRILHAAVIAGMANPFDVDWIVAMHSVALAKAVVKSSDYVAHWIHGDVKNREAQCLAAERTLASPEAIEASLYSADALQCTNPKVVAAWSDWRDAMPDSTEWANDAES